MGDEPWLTAREAAARLRVDVETVRRWIRSGRMRGTLLSDKAGYRIEGAEVERVLRGEPPSVTPPSPETAAG